MRTKEENTKTWDYEDIVNRHYDGVRSFPRMELSKRAAQFAPFSALTGYSEAVDKTARRVKEEMLLRDLRQTEE